MTGFARGLREVGSQSRLSTSPTCTLMITLAIAWEGSLGLSEGQDYGVNTAAQKILRVRSRLAGIRIFVVRNSPAANDWAVHTCRVPVISEFRVWQWWTRAPRVRGCFIWRWKTVPYACAGAPQLCLENALRYIQPNCVWLNLPTARYDRQWRKRKGVNASKQSPGSESGDLVQSTSAQ